MLIRRRKICLTLNYSRVSLQVKMKGENFKKFMQPDFTAVHNKLCAVFIIKRKLHTITKFYSLAALVRIILFLPLKKKIISSCSFVIYPLHISTFNQFCNEVSRALKRVTCRAHVIALQICCLVCKLSHHSLHLDII